MATKSLSRCEVHEIPRARLRSLLDAASQGSVNLTYGLFSGKATVSLLLSEEGMTGFQGSMVLLDGSVHPVALTFVEGTGLVGGILRPGGAIRLEPVHGTPWHVSYEAAAVAPRPTSTASSDPARCEYDPAAARVTFDVRWEADSDAPAGEPDWSSLEGAGWQRVGGMDRPVCGLTRAGGQVDFYGLEGANVTLSFRASAKGDPLCWWTGAFRDPELDASERHGVVLDQWVCA